MLTSTLLCFCLTALLGILNASHVGELVRLTGLVKKPELNGCVGVVKALGDERVPVKVFMSNEFTAPDFTVKSLDSFFKDLSVKPENLEAIEFEDWKPEIVCDYFDETGINDSSIVDQKLLKHLSGDDFVKLKNIGLRLRRINTRFHDADVTAKNPSPNMKLVGAWMNQHFRVSFLKSYPEIVPFKYDTFAFVQNLAGEFNGKVVILGRTRRHGTEALVFTPTAEMLAQGQPLCPEDAFKTLLLSEENIRLLTRADWKYEVRRSREELLAEFMANLSSLSHGMAQNSGAREHVIRLPDPYRPSTLTADQHLVLQTVKKIIADLCNDSGYVLLNDPEIRGRALLIGAWINLHYGHHGMVYVCEFGQDHNRNLKEAIEWLWDGIGQWLR